MFNNKIEKKVTEQLIDSIIAIIANHLPTNKIKYDYNAHLQKLFIAAPKVRCVKEQGRMAGALLNNDEMRWLYQQQKKNDQAKLIHGLKKRVRDYLDLNSNLEDCLYIENQNIVTDIVNLKKRQDCKAIAVHMGNCLFSDCEITTFQSSEMVVGNRPKL